MTMNEKLTMIGLNYKYFTIILAIVYHLYMNTHTYTIYINQYAAFNI